MVVLLQLTEIPTYLNNIQHFPLKANGFLSALPYLLMWLNSIAMGLFADFLVTRGYLSVVASRKIFNTVGFFVPAVGLIWLAFVGCDQTLSIVALCLSVGFNGAIYSGYQVNHVDLSPNYAGTLMGITNMFANISGFVTPYVTGAITENNVRASNCDILDNLVLRSSGFCLFASANDRGLADRLSHLLERVRRLQLRLRDLRPRHRSAVEHLLDAPEAGLSTTLSRRH